MAEKILVRIARNLGYVGILVGGYCGFLARDEYNFSTFDRIHELSDEYNQKLELLDLEKTSIETEIGRIKQQRKEEQKQKKLKKQTKSDTKN